jgi:1D-myo-inositol 3-kinase
MKESASNKTLSKARAQVSTRPPAFLAIGHVTTDLVGGQEIPGGTAFYSATQALALGLRVRVLTSASRDWSGHRLLRGAEVHLLESEATTTFAYETVIGERRGRLTLAARPLRPVDLPPLWAESEVALLCPVFQETAPAFAHSLRATLLGLSPQGWMRRRGPSGAIERAPWAGAEAVLARSSAVFFSEQDAADADQVAREWAHHTRLVVLTRGARGATIFTDSSVLHVPAAPAREVDPTGAGDVFATAFLIALYEGAPPREAAEFAAAAAACAVEAPGVAGIRGRPVIEARKTSLR